MARVLILDDDVAALAVAKRAVRAGGHDAYAVTSVADAAAALDAPTPPDVLLASPAADAGEALLFAERMRADPSRGRVAVLLVGDAGRSSIPAIPVPLDGASVGAGIAAALASRAPGLPQTGSPEGTRQPARRPVMQAAEASLRALFRRQPTVVAPLPQSPPAKPIRERLRGGPTPAQEGPRPDLAELVTLARTADYFSLLGVQRSASSSEIREAAARLLAEVDAQLLTGAGTPPPGDLREARQVLLDARDMLGDDGLRAAYLNGIEDVADSNAP